jgi:hypothetical protein
MPKENIITQDQRHRISADKISPNSKCVCQAAWFSLFSKSKLQSPLAAIPQQA